VSGPRSPINIYSSLSPKPESRSGNQASYVDGPLLARLERLRASKRLRSYVRSVVAVAHDRWLSVRGILRGFGLKVGKTTPTRFAALPLAVSKLRNVRNR
jgi:hypothetical protein